MSRFSIDPTLTGNLTAEYEALQNNLEQAKLLAADYQNQLSDKTNDYAALKQALERTVADLEKLQSHIVALREERHKLANEVMRVVALEAKIAALTEELSQARAGKPARDEKPAPEEKPRREEKPQRETKREFIHLGDEVTEGLTVIVTPTPAVRAPKPYQPRP